MPAKSLQGELEECRSAQHLSESVVSHCLQFVLYFSIAQFWGFVLFQVLLARHKAEEQFYAVKVLQKKAILKKKEVSCFLVMLL